MKCESCGATGWMPIDSAPRDGYLVLYDKTNGVYTGGRCGDEFICGEWDMYPTHWMPLPNKPEDTL